MSNSITRIADLTQKELVALTQEEIARYKEIELMIHGLVWPVRPVEPVAPAVPRPTEKYFQIGDLLFKEEEAFSAINNYQAYTEEYDYYGAGYTYKWVKPTELSSTPKFYYKEEVIRAVGAELKAHKTAKEKFDEELKVYTKEMQACEAVVTEINEMIEQAHRHTYAMQVIGQTFDKFVELSNGDTGLSMKFLVDKYSQASVDQWLMWKEGK